MMIRRRHPHRHTRFLIKCRCVADRIVWLRDRAMSQHSERNRDYSFGNETDADWSYSRNDRRPVTTSEENHHRLEHRMVWCCRRTRDSWNYAETLALPWTMNSFGNETDADDEENHHRLEHRMVWCCRRTRDSWNYAETLALPWTMKTMSLPWLAREQQVEWDRVWSSVIENPSISNVHCWFSSNQSVDVGCDVERREEAKCSNEEYWSVLNYESLDDVLCVDSQKGSERKGSTIIALNSRKPFAFFALKCCR